MMLGRADGMLARILGASDCAHALAAAVEEVDGLCI
jgi:hypothetical protein